MRVAPVSEEKAGLGRLVPEELAARAEQAAAELEELEAGTALELGLVRVEPGARQ
jgi:acyl-CoA hydrolase